MEARRQQARRQEACQEARYQGPPFELFNLAADLGEKANLADKHPDRVRQLQAELAAWEKQVSEGVTKRT